MLKFREPTSSLQLYCCFGGIVYKRLQFVGRGVINDRALPKVILGGIKTNKFHFITNYSRNINQFGLGFNETFILVLRRAKK